MRLVNKVTGRPYGTSQIIEWMGRIVRIKAINAELRAVFLDTGNGIPFAVPAGEIGAEWRDPTIGRPHGMTKKEAMDRYYKEVIARENSLGGGRCASTGLFGMARIFAEQEAKGRTATGRTPSRPEMQELPARDMRGARAGIKPDDAEAFKVEGKLEAVFTDEQLHAAQIKAAQLGGTENKLHYALAMAGCNVMLIDGPEFDAILAGLALLREAIPAGLQFNYDSIAGQCWTNGGDHDGLGVEAVQALADRLNHGA